jgi:hypothetical protein
MNLKDTTESDKSASYLDILLNIDSNGRLTTTLYDKRDDFDFAIVNFLSMYSVVIYNFHLLMMCISPSWFDTQEHDLHMRTFQNKTNYWPIYAKWFVSYSFLNCRFYTGFDNG